MPPKEEKEIQDAASPPEHIKFTFVGNMYIAHEEGFWDNSSRTGTL